MGFRISWLASRQPKPIILSALGLADTSRRDEANEADFSVAELPTDWTVLWSNDPSYAKIAVCQPLARQSPVVSCWVNETAMISSVNYFDQNDYWFAGHDASHDVAIEGQPPAEFQDIIDRLMDEQARSDAERPGLIDHLFDIPIEIAQRITGFRHDLVEFEWGTPNFTAVERSRSERKEVRPEPGWLRRFFS